MMQPRSVLLSTALAAACAVLAATTARAQQLYIDSSVNDSPYTIPANASYATIIDGDANTGVINDSAYALTASSTITLGNAATGNGTFNLSGTASLTQTGGTATQGIYVGKSGTGLFSQTGGTLTMTSNGGGGTINISGGAKVSCGAAIDIGYGGTNSTGTINISSGTLSTTKNFYDGYLGTGDLNMTGGTVNVTGNFDFGHSVGSSRGTLEVATGAALNLTATTSLFLIGELGYGTISMTGGTITDSGTTQAMIGGTATATTGNGTVNLSGGTFDVSAGGLYVGNTATGFVTQTGGTLKAGSNGVVVGVGSKSTGTYTLSGGILSATSVTGGAGSSTFNFNGGTLQAVAASTTFVQSLTTANVQSGGAIINTNSFNLTIAQNLVHDPTLGDPAQDGGLKKLGAGALTLSGTNSYTGGTSISAGSLVAANNGAIGIGTISVAAGAGLTINSGVAAASTPNTGALTLTSATMSTVTPSGVGIQETVVTLMIDGIVEPMGTYGAPGSGAMYTNFADFLGTGELMVTVPEPATWLAGTLAVLLGLGAWQPRRWRAQRQ